MKTKLSKFITRIFIFISLIISAQSVFSMELEEAKQAGIVGEQADGYLGAVNRPIAEEVEKFISTINKKRKAKYEEIALKRQVDLSLVEQQSGKKLIERLKQGEFFKKKNEWEKK